jgi:hypothetical protein
MTISICTLKVEHDNTHLIRETEEWSGYDNVCGNNCSHSVLVLKISTVHSVRD